MPDSDSYILDLTEHCLAHYRDQPMLAVALAILACEEHLDRTRALLEELVDLADAARADLKRAGEELTLARHRAGNS